MNDEWGNSDIQVGSYDFSICRRKSQCFSKYRPRIPAPELPGLPVKGADALASPQNW